MNSFLSAQNLKIAIVHDDFIQHGGAERLVLAMLEIWPQADVYGVVASKGWQEEIKKLPPKADQSMTETRKDIKTTWLQNIFLGHSFYRYYYTLYPIAIESINLDGYDLVISSSARYAHGVLTKPGTVHIAYVNSPARFLWQDNLAPKSIFAKPILSWHRCWDKVACHRPDYVIANSKSPAKRIKNYWGREADSVIYPFVDLARFEDGSPSKEVDLSISNKFNLNKQYFLIVTRLNKWKNVDIAINACRNLGFNLYIVGSGPDFNRLNKLSSENVKFYTNVTDLELVHLYKNCQALIVTQEEDFGIVSLEAQAAGKPVIAYGSGGSLETVIEGETGLFFTEQTEQSLKSALLRFDPKPLLRENCIRQARNFSKERFISDLSSFVNHVLRTD